MAAETQQNKAQNTIVHLPIFFRLSVAGVEIIVVSILALICSNLFLMMLERYNDFGLPEFTQQSLSKSRGEHRENDYTYLKTVDAFYNKNSVLFEQQTEQLPESTLDIQIFGIRARGKGSGTVILKSQGSVQKLARVGDEIAAGTLLTAIYADRIEFRRNGRLETIYLDKERVNELSNAQTNEVAHEPSENHAEAISTFVKSMDLSPYREGRDIIGFNIGDGAEKTLLALAGLEVGDIINSVNGNQLHSWERVSEIADESSSGELDIQLERNGETIRLSLSSTSLGQ